MTTTSSNDGTSSSYNLDQQASWAVTAANAAAVKSQVDGLIEKSLVEQGSQWQ